GNFFDQFDQPSAPVTAEGLAKQTGIGLAKGTIGLAGLQGDIGSLYSRGANKLADLAGISPDTADKLKTVAKVGLLSNPFTVVPTALANLNPTSADIKGAIEKVTGPFRKAQNIYEEYGDTFGE